ncbi:MAG: SLC13 family permease [Bacteroidales bacterium]
MEFESIVVLVVLCGLIITLALDKMRPGLLFFSAVILLMLTGTISAQEALAGFSNKGMITVAILFLVSEGVRRSGALNKIIRMILPSKKGSIGGSLAQVLPPIAAISAFLNNTAVVVIFAPIIKKWSEHINMPATKFLIPLSYATILGGVCTLIGTSTNLVVNGMIVDQGFRSLGLFELGKVGLPITFVGLIYLIVASKWLLPGKLTSADQLADRKEYAYNMNVLPGSMFVGQTIENGKLSLLQQFEVRSLIRDGEHILLEQMRIAIRENDQLVLGGKHGSLAQLVATEGIEFNCLSDLERDFVSKKAIKQVEAVLGPRFPGIGKTLGEFDFYRHYGAVVMSVHRNGEIISVGLSDLVLKEGDNLVVLTDGTFIPTWGDSSVFLLLSDVGDFSIPGNKTQRWISVGLVVLMIIGAALGEFLPKMDGVKFDMFFFAAFTMVIMAWTKIIPTQNYTKFINWDILITIACAFGISKAMMNSGIADSIAHQIISIASGYGPFAILAAVYIITNIFTEVITNNAAAALCFPISLSVANQMGIDPTPLFVTICIAASASFATPIGYQTNLIVQSVGNYKFSDYLKIGIPLNIIVFILSIILIPMIWEF